MKALTQLTGIAATLHRSNVDTDQIIPKQFLRKIGKTGFGGDLFFDWRYRDDGSLNPDFELNRPEFAGAKILVVEDNFGCGSSREHAPWALLEYGFRVIVCTSYADIFYNNCYKNGMLPIVVNPEQLAALFAEVEAQPGCSFSVDVETQTLTTATGVKITFEVDPFRKSFLLNGLDDIGWSLQFEKEIKSFEEKQKEEKSWLWS